MKEEEHFLGARKDPHDRRDYRVCGVTKPSAISLPINFELEEKFEPNNQKSRGSCTSQSQSHHKARQENMKVSARFIMTMSKKIEGNKKEWGFTRNSYKAVHKFGVPDEDSYPEPNKNMSWLEYIDEDKISQQIMEKASKHKNQSYWRVEIMPGYTNGWEEIKKTIYQNRNSQNRNSVTISMPWYKSYNVIDSAGVLPKPTGKLTGHSVEAVGWKNEMIKCKNSWSKNWGTIGGYFYIVPNIHKIWDAWTSLDIPENLPVDFRYGEKRTWKKYLLEKKFAFNSWLNHRIGRLPNDREIKALTYGYWPFKSVFLGIHGDRWLYVTYPEYNKNHR